MGLAQWLFGSAVATVDKPVEAVGNALDKLFTSDEERAAAAIVLEKLRQQPDILQAEITKVEAAHPSVFVAGWRPAIGWVCVLSLASYYPPRFIIATCLWAHQVIGAGGWIPPPEVGIADILGLVGTLLGMATLRTVEKRSEVARD
jgi:hypothetical protein